MPDGSQYKNYFSTCQSNQNFTLPNNLQKDICNQNISIPDYIYSGIGGFQWVDGSWNYDTQKHALQKRRNQKNNQLRARAFTVTREDTPEGHTHRKEAAMVAGHPIPTRNNPPQQISDLGNLIPRSRNSVLANVDLISVPMGNDAGPDSILPPPYDSESTPVANTVR
ncbi:hypothetical protein K435DRAFT_801072 [Dendrothele bispora CBS 962.96]|uniref:Uncharacterized protein n=1 Tax=Dendrothele bispora (strain CBS 962.96) TaxID=1314807 RepID=A0A4S8LQH4_DENBC|nr:hypothetical protein K435DRAFT_801072 [Dendrothele bispora CBS 962.96]